MDSKDKLQAEIKDALKVKALDFADTLLSYYETMDDLRDLESLERAETVTSIANLLASMVGGMGVIISMFGGDVSGGEMAILGKGNASFHKMLDLALYMRSASTNIIGIIKASLPGDVSRLIDLAIERTDIDAKLDGPIPGVEMNSPVADA